MILPFRFSFLFLLFLLGWEVSAQSGYTYLDMAGGYHFMPSQGLTGTASLEFAGKRRNSFELMGKPTTTTKPTMKTIPWVSFTSP